MSASAQVEWKSGERFFRFDGRQTFLLGRNPTGTSPEMFRGYFTEAARAGEKLMRIHLTQGFPQKAKAGEVDEAWCARWEKVFDAAATNGIAVLPVFGVWADWNDGSRGENWHAWKKNLFNAALGGPGREPSELLADSECRRLWLRWLDALVRRWQQRPNIAGWEVFSELDLITGASENTAGPFLDAAAAVIRAADARHRPVTASLSGVGEWPVLFRSAALDIVQVHPYGKNLDELILKTVRRRLADYQKPVLIGESGLDAAGTDGLASAPRAETGIRHAIWAAMVSGAMTGRMLWWEDGYDFYSGRNLRDRYRTISSTAAALVKDINFTGFRPVEAIADEKLRGGAIGNDRLILGWFRDAACEPPDWPVRQVTNAQVTLKLSLPAARYDVEFLDPASGSRVSRTSLSVQDGCLIIRLSDFQDAIVCVARPRK